jgi:hypothetical protein
MGKQPGGTAQSRADVEYPGARTDVQQRHYLLRIHQSTGVELVQRRQPLRISPAAGNPAD